MSEAASERIWVALVDDHAVVRRGLRTFLESFPDFTIIGEASSGEEALRAARSLAARCAGG